MYSNWECTRIFRVFSHNLIKSSYHKYNTSETNMIKIETFDSPSWIVPLLRDLRKRINVFDFGSKSLISIRLSKNISDIVRFETRYNLY